MRILIAHNRYRSRQPSGEDIVVDQDVSLLQEAGHVVELYERRSDDIATMRLPAKMAVPARVTWSIGDAREMGRKVDLFRPDIVHVHNTFPLMSAAVPWVAHRRGVPVVATLHNFRLACAAGTFLRNGQHCTECLSRSPVPALVHRCYRGSLPATIPLAVAIQTHRVLRTWQRCTGRFVTMSEFARQLMIDAGLPPDQIVVKPHHIEDTDLRRIGPGRYSLYLGRLSEEKGPLWLVKVWTRDLGPLHVVGDGPQRVAMENLARRRGLDVNFRGALPRAEARSALTQAKVLIMPSQSYETFGMAAAEAMSAGVPVVAPSMGTLPEIVHEGVNGSLYDFGSRESARSAIRRTLDPHRSLVLGAGARSQYEQRFIPAVSLARLLQVYTEAQKSARA